MKTVDKSGEKVRKMFAEIAPRYDLMNHVLSLNIDKSWRKGTLKRLELTGDKPVLDVCTGTGDLALSLAKLASGRFPVIGSDFCASMLELARKKQNSLAIANTKLGFIEADTQALPFDDNTFQAVTVAFGIRNVANTVAGLREMLRVCQPDGHIGILEFSRPTWPVLKQCYDGYFRWILPAIGQTMARNAESAYRYLPESVRQFPSGPAMVSLLEEVGLRNVRCWPMTFGIASLYLGMKPSAATHE